MANNPDIAALYAELLAVRTSIRTLAIQIANQDKDPTQVMSLMNEQAQHRLRTSLVTVPGYEIDALKSRAEQSLDVLFAPLLDGNDPKNQR